MSLRLLFIHGWATDRRVWHYQKGLAREWDTLFIDLPGHGGGRWRRPDFGPALDLLHRILKDGRETLCIGWSMGGEILLSLRDFSNVKGLVIVGSSPSFVRRNGFPFGQSRALVRKMEKGLRKDFEGTLERFYHLNFSDREVKREDYKAHIDLLRTTRSSLIEEDVVTSLEALMEEDLREGLSTIDIPVLIVHGTEDRVCPFDVAAYLAGRLRRGRVEAFQGAGHMPFLTEHRRFNTVIKGFVKEVWQTGLGRSRRG